MRIHDVRETLRQTMRTGLNPYEAAASISLSEDDKEAVLVWALPQLARSVASGMRVRPKGFSPVFVPSKGWMDMNRMTAEDCYEVADEYEKKSEELLAKASQFRSWGDRLKEAPPGSVLGELEAYRSFISERTREGISRAQANGVVMGAPRRINIDQETLEWLFEQRKAGATYEFLAAELNIRGVRPVDCELWNRQNLRRLIVSRQR